MTEEIAAAPGWVDSRLDEAFAGLGNGPGLREARDAYANCLAGAKAPAAPSDTLGSEFDRCRAGLFGSLAELGLGEAERAELAQRLEAVEAELAAES